MIRSAIQPVIGGCITRMPSQSRRRRYPAGLLSLWNAKTPTVCPVGPTIQTSAAGNQPDADGNMVPWPVNHPGRGVMVQPAYSNLLQNSKFEGAVSGAPGTAPTGHSRYSIGTAASLVSGQTMRFTTTAGRLRDTIVVPFLANTIYRLDVLVIVHSGSTPVNELVGEPVSVDGKTTTFAIDGVVVAGSTVVTVGTHTVSCFISVGATASPISAPRWGIGIIAACTADITFSKPQLVASPYQMPYAASGAGATTSVTSTAATSGGNGLAIPLNAAMTAALSGGAFTAAALCWMGVGTPSVVTTSFLTVRNAINDLQYALSSDVSSKIVRAYDGTTAANVDNINIHTPWSRGEIHLRAVQTNAAKTQFRVGYRRYTSTMVAIDANIVWGSWVAYDGSMNPLTHLRFGYVLTVPIGFLQTQLWNKSASDAEILSVQDLAFDSDIFLNYLNEENYTDGDHYVD